MKLGVLGGTFDPVHIGHLIIAEEARVQLSLDRVLFIPAGQPYLRPDPPAASGRHRLAMVRLAIHDNPFFEALSLELDRPGPSYTTDTLRELLQQHGPNAELFLIIGQDTLRDLPRWKAPEELAALCTLVVFARPGYPTLTLEEAQRSLGKVSARIVLLQAPLIGISGTELRRRAATGAPLRYWLPPAVEAYIQTNALYRPTGKEGD